MGGPLNGPSGPSGPSADVAAGQQGGPEPPQAPCDKVDVDALLREWFRQHPPGFRREGEGREGFATAEELRRAQREASYFSHVNATDDYGGSQQHSNSHYGGTSASRSSVGGSSHFSRSSYLVRRFVTDVVHAAFDGDEDLAAVRAFVCVSVCLFVGGW